MNEQESFWAGEFGNSYLERNSLDYVPSSIAQWSKIFSRTSLSLTPHFLELGCNIGINLHALHALFPHAELDAVEINSKAVEQVRAWGMAKIYEGTILNFTPPHTYDFTFTSGVLIHISPENLHLAYDILYKASAQYICVREYYNPTPAELPYRGHQGKLFKRDFAGEILDRYPDLRIVDYGFEYRRDPFLKGDDALWVLMEKK